MNVKVGRIQVEGEGSSKKEAKRDSARKMMELIQKLSADIDADADEEDEEDEEELARLVQGMKIVDSLSVKNSANNKMNDFYHDLQSRPKGKLLQLHKTSLAKKKKNINGTHSYEKMLEDLAEEQGFKVTFVQVDRENEDEVNVDDSNEDEIDEDEEEQSVCLAQLSTTPVAVCYGSGKNADDARESAARHALKYIKMMTKKAATGAATAPNAASTPQNKNGIKKNNLNKTEIMEPENETKIHINGK